MWECKQRKIQSDRFTLRIVLRTLSADSSVELICALCLGVQLGLLMGITSSVNSGRVL